jgi:2-polyprenyl-3-methyl-5-hydroxy-6-metoxy-1,4-benzoquinol methylase
VEAQEFVAEVYRRMRLIYGAAGVPMISLQQYWDQNAWLQEYYRINFIDLMPVDKSTAILDIGSGEGGFSAAALSMGYRDVSVADYGGEHFPKLQSWGVSHAMEVDKDLPTLLAEVPNRFDFIHASHLIEHIPKHDLLENVDAMFYALRPGGRVTLVTPNMNSPVAMWSLFVTLAHEYGFSSSNLDSLISICGFETVTVRDVRLPSSRLRWKMGAAGRRTIAAASRLRNRLYGADTSSLAASILVVGTRPAEDPLPYRRLG